MAADPTHPQPFMQRAWTSLDGDWDFCIDADAEHHRIGDVAFDATITVPFAPETPASRIGANGFVQGCWYRRRVETEPLRAGERLLLHFGGVDRVADVWAGGQHVAHHVGGYHSFTVDITDQVSDGSVELVVRAVDDAADLEVPRGKQDWLLEPHAIWYPRTTGIWKSVWTETVPATRIADVHWVPDVEAMSVTLRAQISGPLHDDGRLTVRLAVGDRVLVHDTIAVTDRTVVRTFPLGDQGFDDRIHLVWWPAMPTLIDADLTLTGGDAAPDAVGSYTALRSVEVADGQCKLNGRPYPLRLVLDQGYWPQSGATPPTVDALRHDIEMTKALGFNGARKHQKTEDIRYFTLADQLGLLTWVEMPSAYRPGPRTAATVTAEWAEIVAAHRNHPSVIAWVPINESWGVPACASDPAQRALIGSLRDLADALDGTRPISANDGWETTGGDIVGVHDYDQDPAALASRWGDRAAIDAVLTGRRPDGKTADLDQAPAAGRAVVLSEFGGIAMSTDTDGTALKFGADNWGYDNADDADDLLRRYREQWAVVHASSALAGACWTQLTDTFQEVNGLLNADRQPKAPLTAIQAATRGRPSP